MVLWEITLGTAYFLGLKRTYRLVLRLQRRLVSPNSPKIRQFLHRKTRTIFDATLKVHRSVQQKDIEIGRNLGTWILRWLNKRNHMAKIGAGRISPTLTQITRIPNKQLITDSYHRSQTWVRESYRRRLATRNLWLTAYPTVAKLLRRQEPVIMNNIHSRQLVSRTNGSEFRLGFGFNGVIRDDIMQFLSHG